MIRKTVGCALGAATMMAMVPAAAGAAIPHGKAPHGKTPAIEHAQLMGALRLDGQLFHVQGVVVEGDHIWVTSVDKRNHKGYLHEFERVSGRFLRRLELTDGARYHPGGISISGRSIWVPVSEMKRNSSAVLNEIDADTLQIRRRIAVADHLGCVAASPTTLIAGNWDSRQFYVFDLARSGADGAPVRKVANPSLTRFQDMKLVDGQLVAGGQLGKHGGSIDWIDWPSMTVTRSLHSGAMRPTKFLGKIKTYTAEGMMLDGRELYLVPQDGPSRMFHFRLDT